LHAPQTALDGGGRQRHLFAKLIGIPLAAMARYCLACDYACLAALKAMRLEGKVVYGVKGVNQGRMA